MELDESDPKVKYYFYNNNNLIDIIRKMSYGTINSSTL